MRRFAFVQSPHLPFSIWPNAPPTIGPSLWILVSSTSGPSTCRPGSGCRLLAAWCLWLHPTCLCTLVPVGSATVPLSTAVPPLGLLFSVCLPSVRVPGSLADLQCWPVSLYWFRGGPSPRSWCWPLLCLSKTINAHQCL